ncbi:hypothetical protein B0T19DRAFT_404324 [Cercophora scortea]|uniref:Uncharacterized protein n=1 Tax=Cercophora scortea TaxID=314031 RepID=A0AAE0I748_9PEZI|nr:hypothetical protein B0T19DRAFT_404324 [Cercophora scortea]
MDRLYQRPSSVFVVRRLAPSEKEYIAICDSSDEQAEPFLDEIDAEPVTPATGPPKHDSHNPKISRKPASLYAVSLPLALAVIITSLSLGLAISIGIIHTIPQNPPPTSLSTPYTYPEPPMPKIMHQPCGSTPEQARSKGCHFDVISFNWLPTQCYYAELSQSFDDMRAWEWFLDGNRTQPLTHAEIMTGEHTGLYVNWEYHVRHCTAMWKKMHRGLLGPAGTGAIDAYIGSVKYPDCGVLSWH